MSTTKSVLAALAVGALFVSGSVFVPDTAAAHCGEHQYTCPGSKYYEGSWCDDGMLMNEYDWYDGFCGQPVDGTFGRHAPCNMNTCVIGSINCYSHTYSEFAGSGC